MSVETPRRLSREEKLQIEVDWIQTMLKDELAQMQESRNKFTTLEHASKFCAFLSLVPKDHHVDVEIGPGASRRLGNDFRFFRREPLPSAVRRYVQIGLPIESSQLTMSVVNGSNPHFVLHEISGRTLGKERHLGIDDLISARVTRDSDPKLVELKTV